MFRQAIPRLIGGGVSFNPLSVAGCKVWYDLAHCTQGAGIVTALPDQSGNGKNATIPGGSEPTYVATSAPYNNLPVMTFPTANTKRVVAPDLGITTGARTFVIVCDIGATSGFMAMCDDAFGIFIRSIGTGLEATAENGANVIDAGAVSTPSVLVWVNNGASSKLYASALTPVTGFQSTPDLTGRTFMLGNRGFSVNAANSQNGSTAHFLAYDSALSSTDVAYLLNGFGAKHGITIGA